MTDVLPAGEAGTADLVREAQLAAVLDRMVNQGQSQAAACAAVGLSLRTFQRQVGSSRAIASLRQQVDGVLAAGVIAAFEGYLAGIERLKTLIDSPLTAPRDTIAAVKALHQILREFGGTIVISTGATVDDVPEPGQRVQVQFDPELLMRGPVTVRVGQSDGRALAGGSDLDQPVNPRPIILGDSLVAGLEESPGEE